MFAPLRFARYVLLAVLVFAFAMGAKAQHTPLGAALPANTSPVEPGPPPVPLADKRSQNAEQLRIAQRKLEASGKKDKSAAEQVAYYQTREAVLAQQDAVEQQINDLKARKSTLEKQLKSPPADQKACTFTELDRLKDLLAADQARVALLADKLTSAKASQDRAQSSLDEDQLKSQQAQNALEKGKDSSNAAALSAAAEAARHDVELATDTLALRKSEVVREQLSQEVQQLTLQLHQDQVARLSPLVTFKEADYQAQVDEIKKSQEAATDALSQAQDDLRSTELELNDVKKQLASATGSERTKLIEEAAAKWRTKQKLDEQIDSLSQKLQQLSQLQTAWQRRYYIATIKKGTNDREVWLKLKGEQKETKDIIDELSSSLRIQILTMKDIRSQLTGVEKKAEAAAKGPPEVLSWIQEQQSQLEETLRIYDQRLVAIESARRVHEKLLDELNASVQAFTPATVALGVWYQFTTIWGHTLWRINGQPITVGMAVQGLATLVFGWIFARFVAAMVAYRLLKRFRLSKDATSAIRSLVFYSVLAGVVLQAMHTLNIDLTAFTIVGGALAIGVGFGSQALINNFVGGLIMLAERPVRLGERITFGGMDGVVEDVGFRCTKLRTNADHLLTIPNSTLVNESIENIDRRRTIRRKMTLALTYNMTREELAAAVRTVRDILDEREIRERIHPIIGFEEFLPRVYFSEFAPESLNIQVVYWYAPADWWSYLEHAERVNFRIMEEFERLGVDFAFPSKTTYAKNQRRPPLDGREPGSYAA
ncbi:MAG TPA: mechanosensitive ion channel domain-containing protein [Lacipirellulaceae bacterium]|nr:mechanosensitive ion channel domain-containing protein [Lacipirellulaceae bacterium]